MELKVFLIINTIITLNSIITNFDGCINVATIVIIIIVLSIVIIATSIIIISLDNSRRATYKSVDNHSRPKSTSYSLDLGPSLIII